MNTTNDFWLIDSNFVGVMRFYQDRDNSDKSIDYMFIEEGIIMGIHGENPPLMKTRKKIVIEEARLLWQKLLNRQLALMKLSSILKNAFNKPFKLRKSTQPTKASQKKRVEVKKKRGELKKSRQKDKTYQI